MLTAIWGFNFVMIKIGLDGYPPLLLNALRFALAALPALVLPRPALPWRHLLLIAATLFFGQFAFLLTGMKVGLSAGLASVVLQAQSFITILIATLVLHERPTARQYAGMAFALAGLVLIGATIGADTHNITLLGFGLCLCAAASWSVGNVLLRGAPPVDMLALVVWMSVAMPLPFLAAALVVDGPAVLAQALAQTGPWHIAAVIYLGVGATLFGYGLWGFFLKTYPATVVAPFPLLVPLFGMLSSALVFGEVFGTGRLIGAACIIGGVAIVVVPWGRRLA